ncbi:MAG: hypothetical protein HY974_00790 [Candidatus Kerfeldbacteria bacterium]|nr:hypothetical protein [Candidatus Kerfeldbacteria bacterium]
MKTLSFMIMLVAIVATSFSQPADSDQALIGHLRNMRTQLSGEIQKLQAENTEIKKELTALKAAKQSACITEQRVTQLIHQQAVSMPQYAPRGKYNQLASRVDATNSRVDNIQAANRLMFGIVERHSSWLASHDTKIGALERNDARQDTLLASILQHNKAVSRLLSAAFRTEADEDDLLCSEKEALVRLRQQLGLTPNGETARSGDRTND